MIFSVLLIGLAAAQPVAEPADFKLDGPGPTQLHQPAADAGTTVGATNSTDDGAPPPASSPPRFHRALGFGHNVSLAFAVRQLVPTSLKVAYGDTVDPDAVVSWQGGHPWNEALQAAITPLGLHVTIHHGMVRIFG